ncbi:MAG TPA: sugar isomerase domain-containing protein, partial [Symbiobacteriaceae bacterium]|nr:sugar isomerase domain-containing protein [Symbiobacteriaceae bacterium]
MELLKSGGLIVSGSLPEIAAVASAAERTGAAALRVVSPEAVAAAKRAAGLPVIASWERADVRGMPVATPDLEAARQLAEAGADAILLDGSAPARPLPALLAELIREIKESLGRPVIAQVATVAEAERALAYGADAVGCTDLMLVRELARQVSAPVVALGPYGAPAEARAALQAGAVCAVVEGDPEQHLARFAQATAASRDHAPTAEGYWAAAAPAIARVMATQGPAIRAAAELCARSLMAGGVVHIFGAGHSRAFGMELSGRAGGLVPMHVFGLEEVAPPGQKGLQLLDLERSPGTAHALLEQFPVAPADVFLIASNSGRNGCPVELALEVKRRGHGLITVTSLEHSGRVTARHPAGLRVFEVADVVIDNGAPYGDAVLTAPGLSEAICAVSSATGALVAQALTAETIRLILAAGGEPPV